MGAFSTGFNIGFSSGMFNSMFGNFGAFNFGCWGFNNWNFNCWNQRPLFLTPSFNFGGFYQYQTPQPMVQNIFNFNSTPSWQGNFNFTTPTFSSTPVLIGDAFVPSSPKITSTQIPQNKPVTTTKNWAEMSDTELKEIYGSYSKDITELYEGTAEDLNKYLEDKGVLKGKGQAFIDAQNTYGISASVLVGICMNESAKGTSNLATSKNNVGGLRVAGSTEFQKFDKVEDCILEMARVLKTGYVENSTRSLTKLYEINARYCPVTDSTDTNNLNKYWAKNVNTYTEAVESALA